MLLPFQELTGDEDCDATGDGEGDTETPDDLSDNNEQPSTSHQQSCDIQNSDNNSETCDTDCNVHSNASDTDSD